MTNVLQAEILTSFVYPFVLVFAIIYAILEKSKILGEDKHQINALVSLVVGLIFVGAAFPKLVVGNLILFMSVAAVSLFVIMLLWGFVFSTKDQGLSMSKGVKRIVGVITAIAFIVAMFWATGSTSVFYNFLFNQTWSASLWTNLIIVVLVVLAVGIAVGIKLPMGGKDGKT